MRLLSFVCVLMLGSPAFAHDKPVSAPVLCEREADCLEQLIGLANRNGDDLTLQLENGTSEVYRSNRQACKDDNASDCVAYELRGYRPDQKVFVVGYTLYEGAGANVVSAKSGQTTFLSSLPAFSPNGLSFVSAENDPHYERKYEIAIWSFDSGEPKQVFRYSTPPNTPEESWEVLGWNGDNEVKLKIGFLAEADPTREFETSVVRTSEGWRLNWPLPTAK